MVYLLSGDLWYVLKWKDSWIPALIAGCVVISSVAHSWSMSLAACLSASSPVGSLVHVLVLGWACLNRLVIA